MPSPLTLLGATTTEEEVVVDLIIGGGAFAIKDGHGCALQSDDNCRVGLVGKDVAAETIALPSEVGSAVEVRPNFLPVGVGVIPDIGVGGHPGKGQDGLLVCDVGRRDLVESPCRCIQDGRVTLSPRLGHHRVHDGRPPVYQSLYRRGAALGLELEDFLLIVAILSG